jgi:N-acetylglutamate synthase-like GNAT family acetyltransferase
MATSVSNTTARVNQPCHSIAEAPADSLGAARYINIRHTVRAMAAETGARPAAFSEKGFYLDEFRGRTLAIAARAEHLRAPAGLQATLEELEANRTRVVLISTEPEALESLLDTPVLQARAADERGGTLETAVWRAMCEVPRAGLAVEASRPFPAACREIAVSLGISKLIWVDPAGGLLRGDGSRLSFVDLEELRALIRSGGDGRGRAGLLGELEATLEAGVPSINLCALEGVGDELFSYAGAGTLLTRERYVRVRRLGLDDYDAADDLIARGVAEGYLAPRSASEIERVVANGFGAFVEGRHLAGIGALIVHRAARAGEIASLYTLTRFLGEGIGGHLVGHALERAGASGCQFAFACTTAERVVAFFERQGFRRVADGEIPADKWRGYDPARRAVVCCLRRDLR